MFDDSIIEFLALPMFARLCTNGANGYPHVVPIWYDIDRGPDGSVDIVFVSDRATTKTRNALRDPKASVAIGGDRADADGYTIRGDISVEEDPGHVMTLRMITRYESAERAAELEEAWKDDDIVILRLRPRSVVKVFG